MAKKLGKDCKFYRCATALNDSDNTPAQATWLPVTNIKDATLNLDKGDADVTTRGSGGWRQTLTTLKDGSIEFDMVWDTGDAAFTAIQSSWNNDTEIALAAMDGDIETAGSQGLASNFSVSGFKRNEPLEAAVTVNVTVKPSSETSWYTCAGS